MKRHCFLLLVCALAFVGCSPKEGPAILNASLNQIGFEAVFADGLKKSGTLMPNTTWWLSHAESPLVALVVSRDGVKLFTVGETTLREWQRELDSHEPLVILVKESEIVRIPLSLVDAEIQRRKKAATEKARRPEKAGQAL